MTREDSHLSRRQILKLSSLGVVGVPSFRERGGGTGATEAGPENPRYAPSASAAADADRRQSMSGGSLRALGERMDPMRPATSLRGNDTPYERGDPPDDSGPDEWSGDASYLVLKRNLDPEERLNKGVRETVAKSGAYDFGMAHRKDKGLVETHRYTASDGSDNRSYSMRSIADRHRTGTECKWLVYNTWLAPGQSVRRLIDPSLPNIPNSDRKFRKEEIGRVIDTYQYDIALLNEVFNNATSNRGEAIRKAAGSVDDYRRGPAQEYPDDFDSGLLGMVLDNSPRRTPEIRSAAVGTFDKLTDWDVFATKGWLYLEIDVGPGNIDVFFTHANSQHVDLSQEDSSPGRHTGARKENIRSMLDAVDNHSRSTNPTIFCGDLNVREDYDEYDWLLRIMADNDLHDVYLTRGGIETSTSYYDVTQSGPDQFSPNYCRRDGKNCHCDDYVVRSKNGLRRGKKYDHRNKRLDYIFVEKPQPEHTINLDILRVRRRIFPRYGPVANTSGVPRCGPTYSVDVDDKQNTEFLSDHMGLEMQTVASPRD